MFQIDNSTAVAAIPAPTPAGPPGYFTDGNPVIGVSATILPAEFMNMLMMENMNVLSAAGITPAKGQYNQLALAIAKIVQGGAAGQASEVTAGILKLSTTPQALAGTDDSTAITPLKLAQKLANFLGQATEAAFGWLKIGTQVQVNAGADDAVAITPKKLAAATQVQAHTAFTSAGTSTALTLTPAPAIQGYATNQRFSVKFHASSGINPTLNVSGKGPKNLKQYDSTGAKVSAVFVADQISDVVNDGVDFVLLAPLVALGQASETVNGSLKIATLALVNALANDLTAVTPLKLGSGFSTTKAVNGYIKLPEWLGSLIIQWGWANVGDDQILDVTLPIAFPNTFYSVIATAQSSTATSGTGTWSGTAFRKSNSVISVGANSSSGTGVTAAGVCWIAIGA